MASFARSLVVVKMVFIEKYINVPARNDLSVTSWAKLLRPKKVMQSKQQPLQI